MFASDKTQDYCAQLDYKQPYAGLGSAEQDALDVLARKRFIAFELLKTSSSSHDKIKSDFSDDFTKGSDNYPTTPQQTLLLLDKYSKKPPVVTQSEGTAFAQKGKMEKGRQVKVVMLIQSCLNTTRNTTRTRSVSDVVRRGILRLLVLSN